MIRSFVLLLLLMVPGCVAEEALPAPIKERPAIAPQGTGNEPGDNRPAVCQCSPVDPVNGICGLFGDLDGDCVCTEEDNCPGTPNCDRLNTDGDAFGDACDVLPNLPDPESTIAALDTRLATLEAAGTGAAITALQADVALLTAALAELRTKYPAHFHGLLGLNGDPVGSSGDLSYALPGDP